MSSNDERESECSECASECGSYGDSSIGDDDRDFDFDDETAQKAAPSFMSANQTCVRCSWGPAIRESPSGKRPRVDEDADATQLLKLTGTLERIQLCSPQSRMVDKEHPDSESLAERRPVITQMVCESMVNRLAVLRVDNFDGCGDPIFGTRREKRRCFRQSHRDLFVSLTGAFKGAAGCRLKKLTLQGGFMSAESLMNFLKVAKPPLESFRCRGCLFHGRNFEPVVQALKSSIADPGELREFEMDAYVGGKDPFGLIADAFPNLRMLRCKRIYGKQGPKAALRRLPLLDKARCKLPKPSHKLRGNFALGENGMVYWFLTSDYHDDGYRGQGLFWDELDNTCECMEEWAVGKGIDRMQVLKFMEECGIELDEALDEEECGMDENAMQPLTDEEKETVVVQLTVKSAAASETVVQATTLQGRLLAESTFETSKTPVRAVIEDLAQKYPCDPAVLRLITPGGKCLELFDDAAQPLAAVLG